MKTVVLTPVFSVCEVIGCCGCGVGSSDIRVGTMSQRKIVDGRRVINNRYFNFLRCKDTATIKIISLLFSTLLHTLPLLLPTKLFYLIPLSYHLKTIPLHTTTYRTMYNNDYQNYFNTIILYYHIPY